MTPVCLFLEVSILVPPLLCLICLLHPTFSFFTVGSLPTLLTVFHDVT